MAQSANGSIQTKSLPRECFKPIIEIYNCKEMYITVTNDKMDFPCPDSHGHDGYEFLMPLTSMPFTSIDGKNVGGDSGVIIPINPWQEHGPSASMRDVRFAGIMIDSGYLKDMAYRVLGERELQFTNQAFNISMELQASIRMFIEEAKYEYPGRDILLESLSCGISVRLLRELCCNVPVTKWRNEKLGSNRIKNIMDYLNEHYNTDCSLDQLADMAGISRYHLIRVFKDITNKTPYEYLIDIRLNKAKELLRKGNMPITEICISCGFNNVSHFTSIFKRKTGVSPSHYKLMVLK